MDEDTLPPQTPPEGFMAQPELSSDQVPELVSRPPDLIADAEAEDPDSHSVTEGVADDDDDDTDDN